MKHILLLMISGLIGFSSLLASPAFDEENPSIKDELQVKFYPNPVSERLTITFAEIPDNEIHVKLIDITGKLTYSGVLRDKLQYSIDFTGFSQGIYILHFLDKNGELIKISKIQKL